MAQQRYLIKNAHIVDVAAKRHKSSDILLEYDSGSYSVKAIAPKLSDAEAHIVNAASFYAVPAFVDIWAHVGEIGNEHRETFATGTNAAVCGGFGYLLLAPDGKSVVDSPRSLEKRAKEAAVSAKCPIGFCASVTNAMKGRVLNDLPALKSCGAVAFSDGKRESMPDDLLYEAMKTLAKQDSLFIGHPRYHNEYKDSAATLGRVSRILGVKGIPSSAEALDVARYILYATETGGRLHLCEVSCKASIDLIAHAKAKGIPVTASTCPQYFSFSENDLLFYGSRAKVYPPLRSANDVAAVVSALADNTIDCISSDHTPLAKDEKGSDLKSACNGSIGLQTAFSAADTYLIEPGKIDLYRLFELMYLAPANILGVDHTIIENRNASFNLISLEREFIVSNNYLKSRSQNSIFMGLNLRGCIENSFISNPSE